jgi:hypothetical protein
MEGSAPFTSSPRSATPSNVDTERATWRASMTDASSRRSTRHAQWGKGHARGDGKTVRVRGRHEMRARRLRSLRCTHRRSWCLFVAWPRLAHTRRCAMWGCVRWGVTVCGRKETRRLVSVVDWVCVCVCVCFCLICKLFDCLHCFLFFSCTFSFCVMWTVALFSFWFVCVVWVFSKAAHTPTSKLSKQNLKRTKARTNTHTHTYTHTHTNTSTTNTQPHKTNESNNDYY